jgi:hypothetical protein
MTADRRRAQTDFPKRVREGLAPLLEDFILLEQTTLNIVKHMNRSPNATVPEDAGFFDFEGKVGPVVAHFAPDGLTRPAYLRAAVQRVALFFHPPETLIHGVAGVTQHFSAHGLTRTAYLQGAVRQPRLFYQKPATVIGHIEKVVDHFRKDGLTCDRYLRAATTEPLLFHRKPDGIIGHVERITDLHRKGLLNLPGSPDRARTDIAAVLEFMLIHPLLFVMPEEQIVRPESLARATGGQPSRKLMIRLCRTSPLDNSLYASAELR